MGASPRLSIAIVGLLPSIAHATVAVPPDLAALEQQMAALQANSERFSFQEEVSFGNRLLGQGIPLVLLIAGDGEAGDSPPQATVVGGPLGLGNEQLRVIGETSYRYDQAAGGIDGGRPWVRSRRKASEGNGLDPGGILENDQGGKQGTFSKLIGELNGALTMRSRDRSQSTTSASWSSTRRSTRLRGWRSCDRSPSSLRTR